MSKLIQVLIVTAVYSQSLSSTLQTCLSATGVFLLSSATNFQSTFTSRIQNPEFINSKSPLGIVLPTTEAEVVAAVACYNQNFNDVNPQLVTRGGGHSYTGYSYTSNTTFILLDLQMLSTVTSSGSTITAGGGSTIGKIYQQCDSASSTTLRYGFAAGSCPDVGAGGHFQGGGYGYLGRTYGLASDNVLSARVVLANSTVVTASTTQNSDLFFAIRGGGGGDWGVITQFTLQMVVIPSTITTFAIAVPSVNVIDVLFEFQDWIQTADTSISYLGVYWTKNGMEVSGWQISSSNSVASFTALIKSNMPALTPFITSNSVVSTTYSQSGLNHDGKDALAFKAKSHIISSKLSNATVSYILKTLTAAPTDSFIIFDSYGGMMSQIAATSTAFPYRAGSLFQVQYFTSYETAQKSAAVAWIDGLYTTLSAMINDNAAYINYIDSDVVVGQDYFGANTARLLVVKQEYDPRNMFYYPNSLVTGGSTSGGGSGGSNGSGSSGSGGLGGVNGTGTSKNSSSLKTGSYFLGIFEILLLFVQFV